MVNIFNNKNMSEENKDHLGIVICGHVDAGKSTTTGHLLFKLGGIKEREMEKLKEEARAINMESFAFAFGRPALAKPKKAKPNFGFGFRCMYVIPKKAKPNFGFGFCSFLLANYCSSNWTF